jgi:DnaJ-class molecular chaperone
VLSDAQRRSDYDQLSSSKSSFERTSDPTASSSFFRMFSGMFTTGNGNGQSGAVPEQPGQRPNADQVFGDVFEDVRHPLSFSPSLYFLTPFVVASTARG